MKSMNIAVACAARPGRQGVGGHDLDAHEPGGGGRAMMFRRLWIIQVGVIVAALFAWQCCAVYRHEFLFLVLLDSFVAFLSIGAGLFMVTVMVVEEMAQ